MCDKRACEACTIMVKPQKRAESKNQVMKHEMMHSTSVRHKPYWEWKLDANVIFTVRATKATLDCRSFAYRLVVMGEDDHVHSSIQLWRNETPSRLHVTVVDHKATHQHRRRSCGYCQSIPRLIKCQDDEAHMATTSRFPAGTSAHNICLITCIHTSVDRSHRADG